MTRRDGFTLLEVIVVLGLLALLLGIAVSPFAHWRDGAAVRAARDDLAAALARTRAAALAHGGATLLLDAPAGRFWMRTPDGDSTQPVSLAARYRVTVAAGRDGVVSIRYDGLGLGRVASRTIRMRRGRAEAGVTVSAYGRFRRW